MLVNTEDNDLNHPNVKNWYFFINLVIHDFSIHASL